MIYYKPTPFYSSKFLYRYGRLYKEYPYIAQYVL